jgi:uncharacterized membrane protein YqaE (UPF0057 family)
MKKFTLFLFAVITVFTLNASVVTDPTDKSTNATTAVSGEKEMVFDNAAVMDAMREFKSLSRVDRKMRMRQVKAAVKEYKAQKKAYARSTEENPAAAAAPSTNTLLLVILAILLPPLAVALHEGGINGKFWLSLLLTLLFWIPGVIYALIVVLS